MTTTTTAGKKKKKKKKLTIEFCRLCGLCQLSYLGYTTMLSLSPSLCISTPFPLSSLKSSLPCPTTAAATTTRNQPSSAPFDDGTNNTTGSEKFVRAPCWKSREKKKKPGKKYASFECNRPPALGHARAPLRVMRQGVCEPFCIVAPMLNAGGRPMYLVRFRITFVRL